MPPALPETMTAVLLTGHGGLDKLEVRHDVAVPRPGPGEVLIQVAAAGINNTDINTRTAWYSKSVSSGTNTGGAGGFGEAQDTDGSWSGTPLSFPRIQGADCCGRIVAVGENVSPSRIGERVLVRAIIPAETDDNPVGCITFGSECDGGFAQFATAPDGEAFAVDCDWSDEELASIPCAYSTAEGMMHRANVGAERVLVTGASGGVGSAAIQLAKRRGAVVTAQCGGDKAEQVAALGADRTIDRNDDPLEVLGPRSIDVVVDLVAGPVWPKLIDLLRPGGRYVTSGAIAGPIVDLDVRTLYLRDLTLLGSTYQEPVVFENLVSYIERGELKPVIAGTYPLEKIAEAQEVFLAKRHVGKLVLIPPPVG